MPRMTWGCHQFELHRGKRTMVWQTRVTNKEGRLLALVTQTQIVLKPET